MAHTGTGFFDRKGNFFKSARDATVSDIAGLLGQIGEGESLAPGIAYMLLERRSEIERLFAEHGFEAVVHSGALHKPDIVRYPRREFVDVNVTGTLNLLEAAVRHEASRFVFTSTTSLMITQSIRDERSPETVWLDEASGPLAPRNIYGVTKRSAEELCRLFHADHGNITTAAALAMAAIDCLSLVFRAKNGIRKCR